LATYQVNHAAEHFIPPRFVPCYLVNRLKAVKQIQHGTDEATAIHVT